VLTTGDLPLHPVVARLMGEEMLKGLGAEASPKGNRT
jgi:hypothetical protein